MYFYIFVLITRKWPVLCFGDLQL
jgi:hypothetical protein